MPALILIRGGKVGPGPAPCLGLPCDSCRDRQEAPSECGDCIFLPARQRRIAELLKTPSRGRKTRRIH